MRIRAFRHIGDPSPISEEVAVVVIERNDGTPVAAASQVAGDLCCFTTAEDEDFHRYLHTLGLDKVMVVDDLSKFILPAEKHRQLPILMSSKYG